MRQVINSNGRVQIGSSLSAEEAKLKDKLKETVSGISLGIIEEIFNETLVEIQNGAIWHCESCELSHHEVQK